MHSTKKPICKDSKIAAKVYEVNTIFDQVCIFNQNQTSCLHHIFMKGKDGEYRIYPMFTYSTKCEKKYTFETN